MKKFFIAALLTVAVAGSAFAADVAKLSSKVKNNFDAQFSGAQNIEWAVRDTYTKFTFLLDDQKVEAFYSADGELIATSRKSEFNKLPLAAIQQIKKQYASYKVEETIEFDQDGDRSYYVSLADGNKKKILQVSLYGNVTLYQGAKK
ncbi:MAG: hypothetical protein JO301_01715 [Chitinophagaceae bacterium]|nr:hypothetical protein [Chitinophagaceae bacterium]